MVAKLFEKYCGKTAGSTAIGVDIRVKKEYLKQHDKLKEQIWNLRTKSENNNTAFRVENVHTMTSNQELITEINDLRTSARKIKKDSAVQRLASSRGSAKCTYT